MQTEACQKRPQDFGPGPAGVILKLINIPSWQGKQFGCKLLHILGTIGDKNNSSTKQNIGVRRLG